MKHFEITLQIVIATWAACVWFTGNLVAAEPAFVVKLTTDKQVYLLGEPATLTATIEFLGQETIEVTHPLDHGEYSETVEFSPKRNSIFDRFITREEASDALVDRAERLPKIKWGSGDTLVRKHILLCWRKGVGSPGKGGLLFSDAGEYVIRFAVRLGDAIATDEKSLTIVAPSRAVDKDALSWLQRGDYLCALEYLVGEGKPTKDDFKLMEQLNGRFTESVYADFVKRTVQAKASSTNRSATEPINPLSLAVRELESQWYDVKGFGRHHPEGHRPMLTIVMDLNDQLGQGKVTQEEFDKRRAELLQQYVRQYSKPLPPEEWKRRYESYAKEDAARAAKQDAQHQEFLKNGARILQETPKPASPK